MKRLAATRWLLVLLVLCLLGGGYWWYLMLSPQGHTLPADSAGVYQQTEQGVFAYGTLTSPLVRWLVLGEAVPAEPAQLAGFRRQGLDLVEAAGEQLAGEYLSVSGAQLRRLDRYERLGSRYYREQHILADGRQAWVYRRIEE